MRSRSVGLAAAIGRYSTGVPDGSGEREAAPTPAAPPDPPVVVREVDLDWRSVLVVIAAFVGLLALTGLVRSIPRTLAALAVGLILALALDPLIAAVERTARVRRVVAVGMVLSGFAVAVVLVGLLLIPPAIRQGRDLGRELPRVLTDLGNLPVIGDDLVAADVPERLERWIEELPDRLEGDLTPIERAGRSIADGLLAVSVTILLAITLLIDGDRLLKGMRRMVPARRRPQAERIAEVSYRVVGRYMAGSLLVAIIAGLTVLTAGLILNVPITPLAAVWVAMWDLVPQIGGAMGGIPFVLLAFTRGAGTGIAAAVFFILYLQIENHVLQPLIVGQAVQLSPPATMTAALIGVSAAGVVGALVAVPLVGAAKAIYQELRPARPAT
jgi:predicted PurR-regulated permease PerM